MKPIHRFTLLLLCLCLFVPLAASAAPATALRYTQSSLLYGEETTFYSYLLDSENYVRLRDVAWYFWGRPGAFSVDWDPEARTVTLTTGGEYMAVGTENTPHEPGPFPLESVLSPTSTLIIDGQPADLRSYLIDGSHYYSLRDLCAALGVPVWWDEARRLAVVGGNPVFEGKTIMVDAGHGGAEQGAFSEWLGPEEALNYAVASRLAALLRADGCHVIETRGQDETVPLSERMARIAALRPDLVVSVHHNASDSHEYSGATVLAQVGDIYGGPSRLLAELLNEQYASLGRPVNDILFRQNAAGNDYYGLLRAAAGAAVPAVISEYAFIDHPEDWMAVDSPEELAAEADAIYRALVDWFSMQE